MAATRTIEIKTEIPGPQSRALAAREAMAVAGPLRVHLPVFAARAENATITDVDGNVFVDFAGGVGVVNAGHAHPVVVEAVAEQAARFLHTDYTVIPYEPFVALAERLCALAPIAGETRAAFFNAGTEAVENAVKLARLYTARPGVIAFEGAFHGRTLLSMTMTSKFHPYKAGMGPYAPEVYRAPFPSGYRGPSTAEALARIERMFVADVPAERIAAIVFEPQLGEGGFVPAPPEFVTGLRAICDRYGIVLVADEVQTGFGRTGRMFAMEHFDVEPDLITVAKSIAAGLPLSGVIGRAAIMDGPHAGAIGGTYIGNPVAQAAALAVLDVFAEEGLVARAEDIGDRIREQMLAWQARWPQIGDVRGLGAMLAIELVRDPGTKEPAPELALATIDAALARGLILLKAGLYGNCIRVLCPLTIEDAVLDEALSVWEDALAGVLG
ncbi:MAG TPA: 4-aminobutyrate--2-oxoglutarate transaminase [Gaiella sp.]|jgi:4-aminobutyrate aminotransferase/(S)-3-amino-2-methylpropionate transaminase|nr:4-aminobutyrate--2-oxoglutarate transaminase [Gaiella sp.]